MENKRQNKKMIRKQERPKNINKRKDGPDGQFPRTVSLMPKEIKTTPIWQFKRRYYAQAAITGSFFIADALNSAIVAQTAVLGNSIHRAIRIKKVRIWTPITTQGTAVTVRLTPNSVDAGNNSFTDIPEAIADTSISIDRPAFVSFKPKENHPSGSWHLSTTVNTNLFEIIANIGSVMDIDYESILNFSGPLLGFTQVLAAAVPGTLYVRNAMTNFVPLFVNNI